MNLCTVYVKYKEDFNIWTIITKPTAFSEKPCKEKRSKVASASKLANLSLISLFIKKN